MKFFNIAAVLFVLASKELRAGCILNAAYLHTILQCNQKGFNPQYFYN